MLLRRSHARHCCLPVELSYVPYFPRPEFPRREVGSVQVHIMLLFASAEITVRPPAGLHNGDAQAPVVEQFESQNAEQAPRMNGSSSPFACAMAPTTSGTDVVEFCSASLPLISIPLRSREKDNFVPFVLRYDMGSRHSRFPS